MVVTRGTINTINILVCVCEVFFCNSEPFRGLIINAWYLWYGLPVPARKRRDEQLQLHEPHARYYASMKKAGVGGGRRQACYKAGRQADRQTDVRAKTSIPQSADRIP